MYKGKIEYHPIVDLSKIDRRMWLDYDLGVIKNALHKYYCTGNPEDFENKEVYDAHYNIIHYILSKKENNPEVVIDLTVQIISKIYVNIFDKKYEPHPIAYQGYLNSIIKFNLIDHIRNKARQPMLLLYEDPQIATRTQYLNYEERDADSYQNEIDFSPEDMIIVNELERYLFELIEISLSLIMIPNGSKSLAYLVYHWYTHRDYNIFKGLPERQSQCIDIVCKMVENKLPLAKYLRAKDRKDEFDE